jgi:hypothetical protein
LNKDVLVYVYYKQKSGGCPLFDEFDIELHKYSSIEANFLQGLTSPAFPKSEYENQLFAAFFFGFGQGTRRMGEV